LHLLDAFGDSGVDAELRIVGQLILLTARHRENLSQEVNDLVLIRVRPEPHKKRSRSEGVHSGFDDVDCLVVLAREEYALPLMCSIEQN